jgi:hypothetical protein
MASTRTKVERTRWPVIQTLQLFAALFVLWLSFYGVGRALLLIPSEFHEIVTETFEEPPADEPEEAAAEAFGIDRRKGAL